MDDTLIHVGLGGGLALMILREVFAFLKTRKNGHGDETLKQLIAQGFAASGEDMKRIREHLHSLNGTLQTVVIALSIVKDRLEQHRTL